MKIEGHSGSGTELVLCLVVVVVVLEEAVMVEEILRSSRPSARSSKIDSIVVLKTAPLGAGRGGGRWILIQIATSLSNNARLFELERERVRFLKRMNVRENLSRQNEVGPCGFCGAMDPCGEHSWMLTMIK